MVEVRSMKKRMVIKGGRVHGVGYRPLLLGIAESLEIGRFSADNIFIDGVEAVEVLVDDEGDKVMAFLDMATKRRPEAAVVEEVYVEDYDGRVMRAESYYRYLTSMQLSKMAEYGGRMLGKQDETIGKQDETTKKQDEMIKKQDETIGEIRGLREEFGDYRKEFRDYRGEFREFAARTDENFRLMSEKYGEISESLRLILETLVEESKETRVMLNENMKLLREAVDRFSK